MAVVVTRDAVKRTAAVSSSTSDAQIDALIADLTPVIEYTLAPEVLADSALEAVISRAATEIIAGEFLAQRLREQGATESFEAGGVRVGESPQTRADLSDPYGLMQRGWARLAPFLKPVYAQSTTRDRERQVTEQNISGW
ncbi:MAG: hypothetical protein HPY54_16790 [Chthonomonadetes bacterium]|jgi:hypothetical protein|nr:hypothetical protein [Chthonomonadetes bacterium]